MTLDSLRGRLLFAGLVGTVLAAGGVALSLGEAFERAMLRGLEQRLEDDLADLAGRLKADPGGGIAIRAGTGDRRYEMVFSGHYWTVRHEGTALHSRSLWDAELAMPPLAPGAAVRYGDLSGPMKQPLRAASQTLQIAGVVAPVQVLVASDTEHTREEIRRFRVIAGVAGGLVGGAVLLMIMTQIAYALRPLRQITLAVETVRRQGGRSLALQALPEEVLPLAEELDGLIAHHDRMVARAGRAAGDLAHALKTPLALLAGAARDQEADIRQIVMQQVERMQASVERYLNVATLGDPRSRTAVVPVVSSLVAMLEQLYRERDIHFDLDVDPRAVFHGSQPDLEEVLGNLIENACKWARSYVRIEAQHVSGWLHLQISDDGPGVPEALRPEVMRRGVKLDESRSGSGLGVSIAMDLVASYGGRLELGSAPAGGLQVSVDLPGSLQSRDEAT